ncbi:hypothetical protein [Clostridium sp.]|uniref:hypothetical protein n=1 Tax=Clostridium sp. TaxID=1506 RepID=UPI001A534B36|nr:hypothetical protein [Clostridium sp.]MBK5241267.1 hypothetical protein [Clostridium sp.]
MIVAKNTLQMDGNTVLSPDESFRKRRYDDLEKSRKQAEQAKIQKDIENKKSVLKNILLVFVIGVTIISRYCMIYSYQDVASKTKAKLEIVNKENSAYKVQLLKFKNINYVEEIALGRLNMVKPQISDIEYMNLSKNNLEVKSELQVKKSTMILEKIKDIIF